MDQDRQFALEAVKLIKDWSSWMITVEVAFVAFIGSGHLTPPGAQNAPLVQWMVLAILLFGISMIAAAWVLGALPWIALNLSLPRFTNPYKAPLSSAFVLNRIPLWLMGAVPHAAFVAGICVLALRLVGVSY